MDTCRWVKADKSLCGVKCKGDYCYNHAPLAMIGYKSGGDKPKPKAKPFIVSTPQLDGTLDMQLDRVGESDDLPPEDSVDVLRKKWRTELDSEFETSKSKGRTFSKGDFPQLINGLYFQTIEEYQDYCEGLEMMSRANQKKHKKHFQQPLYNNQLPAYYTVPAKPTKQDERLKKGWYQRIDSIMHMRYVVYRDTDGWYYALFISIWAKEEKEEALKAIMKNISDAKLPKLRPVVVEGAGQYHATGPYYTFSSADSKFHSGGESLGRIRERIKKAADPKYIPPNLRKMAIAATYDGAVWQLIPEFEHERLKAWLANDCPGWYGNPPKGGYRNKTDNWGSGKSGFTGGYKGTPLVSTTMPQTATHKDFKNNPDSDGLVWDYKNQRWVKRNV